nr:hypothetical protein HmN_000411800 [Hymenolepis microstoma]
MHPTALTRVSQQTDAADVECVLVVPGKGYRRIEQVLNGNRTFCSASSTNGAYFERAPYGPKGLKQMPMRYPLYLTIQFNGILNYPTDLLRSF